MTTIKKKTFDSFIKVKKNKFEDELDNFPIGLIILEKENDNQLQIKNVNSYASSLLDLPRILNGEILKERLKEFKKWENNKISEINLINIILDDNHLSNFKVGTFISPLTMIYVKIKIIKKDIYLCIDNYSDERKNIQNNLIESLKYQYIVTLYHELNNPLNALINVVEENQLYYENNEQLNENYENKIRNNEINLLVHLIKVFIKNFIWYFRLNFELANNKKVPLNSKINLEYQFNKILKQFSIMFQYKEIKYYKDFATLSDKFIETNEKYLNNFLRGIFLLLYHKVPKKSGFDIINFVIPENKLKIIFEKKEPSPNKKKNKINNDIDFKFKKDFDFSKTVQTEEMTKEILINMSKTMNIKFKIHDEDDDKFVTLIIPFTVEKEDVEILDEFSPSHKLSTLNAINRTLSVNIQKESDNSCLFVKKGNLNNSFNAIQLYNITVNDFDEKKSQSESIFDESMVKKNKENNLFIKKISINDEDSFISSFSDLTNIKDLKTKSHINLPNEFNTYQSCFLSLPSINTRNNNSFNHETENNSFNDSFFSLKRGSIKTTSRAKKALNDKDENKTTQFSTFERKINNDNINCKCNDILLCDDETFNLSTIKNMLKKFKIESDTSTNGQECIDAILNKKKLSCSCDKKYYKLIFLDMMMPIMNGLEAAKKIQDMIDNKEINEDLKIIIVSAHIEKNLLEQLENIKCIVEEVNKPLKKNKLEELLNTFYFKKK